MSEHRVFSIKFSSVYPLYIQKAERKGRTKEEVDRVICWLTGYSEGGLQQQLQAGSDLRTFFAQRVFGKS
jgi:hypothetical protein